MCVDFCLFSKVPILNSQSIKMSTNIFWLVSEKLIVLLDGLVVGAIVARYLGPSKLGQLAYASSILALLLPIVSCGFDRVAVRNFNHNIGDRPNQFWSICFFRIAIASLIFSIVFVGMAFRSFSFDTETESWVLWLTLLGVFACPIRSANLVLEAEVLSKWKVWVNNSWLVVSSLSKLIFVYYSFSVIAFAGLQLFISIASSISVFLVLKKIGLLPDFKVPTWHTISALLIECWPLAIGGLTVALHMNLDVSMLKWMRGNSEAGIYSTAVLMSSVFYFLPVSLQSTVFPRFTKLYFKQSKEFDKTFRTYIDLNVFLSYLIISIGFISLPILVFGDFWS